MKIHSIEVETGASHHIVAPIDADACVDRGCN